MPKRLQSRREILAGGTILVGLAATGGRVGAQNETEGESDQDGIPLGTRGDDDGEGDQRRTIPGETTTLQGTGQQVSDQFDLSAGPILAAARFSGDASLSATAVPQGDHDTDTPIILSADTSPAVGGGMISDGPYVIEVEPLFALGDEPIEWELTMTMPEVTDELSVDEAPVEYEGEGSAIVGPVQLEGTETATFTHEGEGGFDLFLYPQDGEYGQWPFTGSDTFEGETTVDSEGVNWVTVQAAGAWTLTLESPGQ